MYVFGHEHFLRHLLTLALHVGKTLQTQSKRGLSKDSTSKELLLIRGNLMKFLMSTIDVQGVGPLGMFANLHSNFGKYSDL